MQGTNEILNILNERIIFENPKNMNILEFSEFIPNPMALYNPWLLFPSLILRKVYLFCFKTHVNAANKDIVLAQNINENHKRFWLLKLHGNGN